MQSGDVWALQSDLNRCNCNSPSDLRLPSTLTWTDTTSEEPTHYCTVPRHRFNINTQLIHRITWYSRPVNNIPPDMTRRGDPWPPQRHRLKSRVLSRAAVITDYHLSVVCDWRSIIYPSSVRIWGRLRLRKNARLPNSDVDLKRFFSKTNLQQFLISSQSYHVTIKSLDPDSSVHVALTFSTDDDDDFFDLSLQRGWRQGLVKKPVSLTHLN